jgi:hypothetical protein
MKNAFLYTLRKIDYFNQSVQLTFNNEKKFGTYLGGILSLVIFSLIVALAWGILSDLFNRRNPKTSMTSTYYREAPMLNLSSLNMIYASYFMSKDFEPFYDTSYFKYEIFHFKKAKDGSNNEIQIKPLNFVDCSKYLGFFQSKGLEQNYIMNNIDKAICFNTSQAIIGGSFDTDYFSNVFYSVKKCNNKTSEVVCKPESIINDKIKGGYFEFYYVEKNIDLNNYTTPFTDYFKSFFILLDPQTKKFIDIYIKIVNITSDIGWLFEEYENIYDITFDYFREQIESSVDGELIRFYINSSNNKLYYKRQYIKFSDIAATVGGVLKALLFIGNFLTYLLTEFKMYENMINQLFLINENEQDHKKLLESVKGNFKKNHTLITEFKQFEKSNNLEKNHKIPSTIEVRNNCRQHKVIKNNLEHKMKISQEAPVISIINHNEVSNQKIINPHSHSQMINLFQVNKKNSIHIINSNVKEYNKLSEESLSKKIPVEEPHSGLKFIKAESKLEYINKEIQINPNKRISLKPETQKHLNKKTVEFKFQLERKFPLGIWNLCHIYVFKYCCKNSKRKSQYFTVAFDKLTNYLDFLMIIKTLQEFHKLKKVLFTKNQRILFSAYNKPTIDENKILNYDYEKKKVNYYDLNYYKIHKSLKEVMLSANNNLIDKKLIENLDKNLKLIFDEFNNN